MHSVSAFSKHKKEEEAKEQENQLVQGMFTENAIQLLKQSPRNTAEVMDDWIVDGDPNAGQ